MSPVPQDSAIGFDPVLRRETSRRTVTDNLQSTVQDRAGAPAMVAQLNLQEALTSSQGGGQNPFRSFASQGFLNEKMERVNITGVQFIADLALFARPVWAPGEARTSRIVPIGKRLPEARLGEAFRGAADAAGGDCRADRRV